MNTDLFWSEFSGRCRNRHVCTRLEDGEGQLLSLYREYQWLKGLVGFNVDAKAVDGHQCKDSLELRYIRHIFEDGKLTVARPTCKTRTVARPALHQRNNWPKLAYAQNTKIGCLYVNKPTFSLLLLVKMSCTTSRKSCVRYFTPPTDLSFSEGKIKTPQRCRVLFAKAYSQELSIPILSSLDRKVTSVALRIQSQILQEKESSYADRHKSN
jgi:hypothetical protein